jgi:K+/H+ antiporter YhaU regulatory subunit KhtT
MAKPVSKFPEQIPPMRKGQLNIYKPSDIKRWGVERFLAEVAPKEPIQPNFNFTDEEQKRMDQILSENSK